jgi:hypothetical protein
VNVSRDEPPREFVGTRLLKRQSTGVSKVAGRERPVVLSVTSKFRHGRGPASNRFLRI